MKTFRSVQQHALIPSGRWRVVRLDRDYLDLQELIGPCQIDGERFDVVAVAQHSRGLPWFAGEAIPVEVKAAGETTISMNGSIEPKTVPS